VETSFPSVDPSASSYSHGRRAPRLVGDVTPPFSTAGAAYIACGTRSPSARSRDRAFNSLEHAQRELDRWVTDYNNERPHQALEMAVPAERFRLVAESKDPSSVPVYSEEDQKGQWVLRRVASNGVVSVDNQMFSVANAYKKSLVDVFVADSTIQVWSQNHLIKTVARLRKGPVRKVRGSWYPRPYPH
jgi:hypothetical protein